MTARTDQRTLAGAQQDWAVVINPEVDREQRMISMHRVAYLDLASNGRVVTPMVYAALEAMEDGPLLEEVTEIIQECFQDTMADITDMMQARRG